MKKYRIIITVVLIIVMVWLIRGDKKKNITTMVQRNLDIYEKVVTQILDEKVEPQNITVKGVKDIQMWNGVQIDFTCAYSGFGPSSTYVGFYYSADDVPRAFQGEELPFKKYENGLKWEEKEGDNWCYVEKLQEHWYYFEMHF